MIPGVTDRKVTHLTLVKPEVSKASENAPRPSQFGCQTDRQELPLCLILTPPPRKHKRNVSPPFSPQQHWYRPRTIHQSVPSITSSPSFQGTSKPISDIHSAHMLTSDSFVKYQCICCPGAVPKTSCTIHTHHSLSLVCLYRFYLILCVVSPSQIIKKKKNSSQSMILSLMQQTTFKAPFSKERSRRHWVSVWCKTACFGWNTLPPLCSGTVQPRGWSGDGVCFFVFFSF